MGCGQSTPTQTAPVNQKPQQSSSPNNTVGGTGGKHIAGTSTSVANGGQVSVGINDESTSNNIQQQSQLTHHAPITNQSIPQYTAPTATSFETEFASDSDTKRTTISYIPPNNSQQASSVKKTTNLISKISPSSAKRVRNTSTGTKGKVGGKNATHIPPAPLVVRPRSDTWSDTNITQQLDVTLDYRPDSNERYLQQSNNAITTQHQGSKPTNPTSSSFAGGSIELSTTNIDYSYTIQDQWKMLWATQSPNLVDPADVPAVIDMLLDKTVNRLSPSQLTFLQRKVRSTIHRLCSLSANATKRSNPSGPSSNKKGLFGTTVTNNNANATNASLLAEIAETKDLIGNHHLLSATVVRHVLPKASQPNSDVALVMSSIAKNAISLMLSLSCTSSQSFLWDRAAFASKAAAEIAKLEMDVNKKIGDKTIPKPSQVPIIEGGEDTSLYPPGITLSALSAVISLALQSPLRHQKLQLLFYLCLKPEVLVEFLTTHPAGGVPVWLLEVGNDTVISLASLTHYHYYGHAFLPSHVPLVDEMNDNKYSDSAATATNNRHSVKYPFIPSQSRQPLSIPMKRIQSIIQLLLETERQNMISFQEKRNRAVQQQQQSVHETNDKEQTQSDIPIEPSTVGGTTSLNVDSSNSSSNTNSNAKVGAFPPPVSSSYYSRRYRSNEAESNQQQQQQQQINSSNHSTSTATSAKMMGRKGPLTHSNSAPMDGINYSGQDSTNIDPSTNLVQPQHKLFQITDVMERLTETSSICKTSDNELHTLDTSTYCYPPDDSSIPSPIDVSFDNFLTGTNEFVRRKGVSNNDNNNNHEIGIDVTLEDFVIWTDLALDDVALNIIMYKLFGEGIFPSPAMERELVLRKWLEWQSVFKVIMTVATISSRREENTNVVANVDARNRNNHVTTNENGVNGELTYNNDSLDKTISDTTAPDVTFSDDTIRALISSNDALQEWYYSNGGIDKDSITTTIDTLLATIPYGSILQKIYSIANMDLVKKQQQQQQRGRRTMIMNSFFVWGGIGLFDGGGGNGYGILYCIPKQWWDEWCQYTGWTFDTTSSSSSATTTTGTVGSSNKNRQHHRSNSPSAKRPWSLSTESLVDHVHDTIIRGSMGSFEVMKPGLQRNVDYVLIPPGVWDVLFEIYGGGPPLPRMINSPDYHMMNVLMENNRISSVTDLSSLVSFHNNITNNSNHHQQHQHHHQQQPSDEDEEEDGKDATTIKTTTSSSNTTVLISEGMINEVEIVPTIQLSLPKALSIPHSLSVSLYPWVLHVQLCDPYQPYRRGETGHMSIRVMGTPYQPLWRMFAEIVCRFSYHSYKVYDPITGTGKARLWKKNDPQQQTTNPTIVSTSTTTSTVKEPATRYGPWNLLCKNRYGILPKMSSTTKYWIDDYERIGDSYISSWKAYADNSTLESIGLSDRDQLMLEFAIVQQQQPQQTNNTNNNKSNNNHPATTDTVLVWPREAAAKAGRVRRLAEEDQQFRRLLQGLGEDGSIILKPPSLVGLYVDAMEDTTGKWYTVQILEVDIVDDDDTDIDDNEVEVVDENEENGHVVHDNSNDKTDVDHTIQNGQSGGGTKTTTTAATTTTTNSSSANNNTNNYHQQQQQQLQQKQAMSRKKVRVSFQEHGGHSEWIDVESDRLATAGRFATSSTNQAVATSAIGVGVDADSSTASATTTGALTTNQGNTASAATSPATTTTTNNLNGGGVQSPSSAAANNSNNLVANNNNKMIVAARKGIGATSGVNNTNNDESGEHGKLCTFPGYGACGLSNVGNTCYMNSALQCVSYLPLLRSYLLSTQYRATGDYNTDNVLGTGGKLLEETAELMKFLWSTKIGEKSPTKFRSVLVKMNTQFVGVDQQDAQEFLNYIIDVLHEDSYKLKQKPYVEPLEDEFVKNTKLVRVGEEAWRRYLRRNQSIMADVTMGQALNTVTCPVCQYSSRIFDPFNLLSIPIPTISNVLFQCTVYRRATASNCPFVLGKGRKGSSSNGNNNDTNPKRRHSSSSSSRFPNSHQHPADNSNSILGVETDHTSGTATTTTSEQSQQQQQQTQYIAERYVIALSRLADSGDLRLQIQNVSGIRANQLRLCRVEELIVNHDPKVIGQVVQRHHKVYPLSDKDGPASSSGYQQQQYTTTGANTGTAAATANKQPQDNNSSTNERIPPLTEIVAFEMTLNARVVTVGNDNNNHGVATNNNNNNTDDDYDFDYGGSDTTAAGKNGTENDSSGINTVPSPKMISIIEKNLEVYGDEMECRVYDTDALVLAKAVSRSLWPRSDTEFKLGLRVDAMDHRGNWFPGSVIEIVDEQKPVGIKTTTTTQDANHNSNNNANNNNNDSSSSSIGFVASTGPSSSPTGTGGKRVRVHFDNFSSKWDEMYSIEHLKQGRVKPLYSHAIPKRKPTEFLVHHRYTDRQTGQLVVFGQSFYVQCQNEWSNARAGAHILAQICRFMQYSTMKHPTNHHNDQQQQATSTSNHSSHHQEAKAQRLYEKTHAALSDLIDLLVDCDREYVRLALGVSQHNNDSEKAHGPFRNPTFDGSLLSIALMKKVNGLLQRLPFEVCVCIVDGAHSDKPSTNSEEVFFPFSLVRTIGNFMTIKHAIFLQWRDATVIIDKKHHHHNNNHSSSTSNSTPSTQTVSFKNYLNSQVMYTEPFIKMHESCSLLSNNNTTTTNNAVANANAQNTINTKAKTTTMNANTGTGSSAGLDLSFCIKEFCKVQTLSLSDSWKCPVCKVHREGRQNMNLWKLPDVVTFHIKRFNMSARWHEKIVTKVNFPLTGLDLSEFCHEESPVLVNDRTDSSIYDLIGVMNHYGSSLTGGHYVALCKATACSKDGREEVGYSFNGLGTSTTLDTGIDENGMYTGSTSNGINVDHNLNSNSSASANDVNLSSAWVRLGGVVGGVSNRNNQKNQQEMINHTNRIIAASESSKAASESAEPLWLQFDDEVVEPISPNKVVSEMAYVLFYRRRNLSPSNIAKYSTLD